MDALPQIYSKYEYLFLTLYLSGSENFTANIDKPAGRMTSGRVLAKPPFNLWPVEEKIICNWPDSGGIIRTTFYKLAE